MTKKYQRQAIAYSDELANSISWCAMRPHSSSETRNCMISHSSDDANLQFKPIFTLQYIAAAIGAVITICLMFVALSSLTNVGLSVFSIADPNVKIFTFLFGTAAIALIINLLRKPIRALVFNKSMGVFWIEKQRVFGWNIGDSAQMPLSQIYALQIISIHSTDTEHADNKAHGNNKYEVNVVFRTGERVNIINHRNGNALRHDASKLAEFLDVPVWDKDIDTFNTIKEPAAEAA